MRTFCPYGLNDRIDDEYKKTEFKKEVGKLFPPLSRNHHRISRGQNRRGNAPFSAQSFLDQMNFYLKNKVHDAINFIRIAISSMTKNLLKNTHVLLTDCISEPANKNFYQWYLAGLDIIESKLYRTPIAKTKKEGCRHICKVFFHNKAVELINLPRILKNDALHDCIPSTSIKFEDPIVTINCVTPYHLKFSISIDLSSLLMLMHFYKMTEFFLVLARIHHLKITFTNMLLLVI